MKRNELNMEVATAAATSPDTPIGARRSDGVVACVRIWPFSADADSANEMHSKIARIYCVASQQ